MNNADTITPADLAALREAALRSDLAARSAEIAKLRMFVAYGMTSDDTFDLNTGRIVRAPKEGNGHG